MKSAKNGIIELNGRPKRKTPPKRNKDTTQTYFRSRTRQYSTPKLNEKYVRTSHKLGIRPQHQSPSEVRVPPPKGFGALKTLATNNEETNRDSSKYDASKEFDEVGEAADLADENLVRKQLEEKNPKIIHSKLKNALIHRDVSLYQNDGIQKRPKQKKQPKEEEYYDGDDEDGDGDEYEEKGQGGQGNDEDEYEEVEYPDDEPEYEIIDEVAPARPRPGRPRPVLPRRPVRPRDPTLAVVTAGRDVRLNKLTPRRRRPIDQVPCNQNHSAPLHRKTNTKTIIREEVVKSTKKFYNPDDLYAEIAAIIDRKKRYYHQPGHDKTHWELKIVPAIYDEGAKK